MHLIANKIKKDTTLSEQFRNSIEKSRREAQPITLTHKYMTTNFHDSVQAFQ